MEMMVPVLRAPNVPMELEPVRLAPPQPGEVRVRLVASGVCHSCLHAADGSHATVPMPIVLGDEGAGVVEAVGPDCRTARVGDHVVISWAPSCGACAPCLRGRPALCLAKPPFGYADATTTRFSDAGGPIFHYGPATYSPAIVVPESAAIPIRADMPLEKAALIGCCVMTGVGAVVNTAQARMGESVAVFGCGGVGLNAIQAAAMIGAHPVVGVDLVASKLAYARSLGATHTVDASAQDPVEALRELTGAGVDHAIVAVGAGAAVEQAIAALGPAGTCVILGGLPTGQSDVRLDTDHVRAGERRVVGSSYGSANPAVDFPKLVDLYLAGKLRIDELVTRRYGLDEVNEAFAQMAAGDDARGLIVF